MPELSNHQKLQLKTEEDCERWLQDIIDDPQTKLYECSWLCFGSCNEVATYTSPVDGRTIGYDGVVLEFLASWGGPSDGFRIREGGTLHYFAQWQGTHAEQVVTNPTILEFFEPWLEQANEKIHEYKELHGLYEGGEE